MRSLADISLLVNSKTPKNQPVPVGVRAPDLVGTSSAVTRESENAQDISGSTVLFLSSTCSYCRNFFQSLGQFSDLYPRASLIAVCLGARENWPAQVPLSQSNITVVYDHAGETAGRYGIGVFPTAVAIDSHQTVRAYANPKDDQELRTFMLENSAPPVSSAAQ